MKKSKKLLSVILAVVIALSSLTVGFYAIAADTKAAAAAAEEKDPAVVDLEASIVDFNSKGYQRALFKDTDAKYEAANTMFKEIAAKIKALSDDQKLQLEISNYAYFLYYATEYIGRQEADKESTAGKVYGITEGYEALCELMGALPKDYEAARQAALKSYVKIDGTLFNSSLDFQKVEAAFKHYEDVFIPEFSKLNANGLKFAMYLNPSGDGFYVYASSPTSSNSYIVDQLSKITVNYYQDKDKKKDPSSSLTSYSTYMTGSSGKRVWKEGQSGKTYREGFAQYDKEYSENTLVYTKKAFDKTAEFFAQMLSKEFKNAFDAVKIAQEYNDGKKLTLDDVDKAKAVVAAVTDPFETTVMNKIFDNSSLVIATSLTYPLGSPEAYDAADANTVYSNEIDFNKFDAKDLVGKLDNVAQEIYLNEFYAYMEKLDLTKPSDAKVTEVLALYHKLNAEFQGLIKAEVKADLVKFVVSNFTNYMDSIDMNKITTEIQKTAMNKYNLLEEFKSEVPTEYVAQLKETQKPIKYNASAEVEAFVPTEIVRPDSDVAWTTGGIQTAVDALWNIITNLVLPQVAPDLDISAGLDKVLADNLYQVSIVKEILNLYVTLSKDTTDLGIAGLTLGGIIKIIASPSTIANNLVEEKYAGAVEKIKACGNGDDMFDKLAATEFTAEDFGFKAGDQAGFIDALLAVLRPITTLLAPGKTIMIFVEIGVQMFPTEDATSYHPGVYGSLIPLLEQLGITGLPTPAEYQANYEAVKKASGESIAADEFLRPVINGLFDKVVAPVSADPLNGIIQLLPRIAHIINTDMINTTLKEVFPQMGVLSGLGGSLDLSKDVINNMLFGAPIDLSGLVGVNCKITLDKIDWARLANAGTIEAVKSSSDWYDTFALRTGTADLAFTELFYYLYDVIFENDANYKAVKNLINSLLDNTIAGIVIMVTDQIRNTGKVETYGLLLDLVGSRRGEEIPGRPAGPTDPDVPTDPDKPTDKPSKPSDKPDNLPVDPVTPNHPTGIVTGGSKNPSLPDTGAEIAAASFGSIAVLGAMALALSIIIDRKRKASAEQ